MPGAVSPRTLRADPTASWAVSHGTGRLGVGDPPMAEEHASTWEQLAALPRLRDAPISADELRQLRHAGHRHTASVDRSVPE